jgi:hypothetical protein
MREHTASSETRDHAFKQCKRRARTLLRFTTHALAERVH